MTTVCAIQIYCLLTYLFTNLLVDWRHHRCCLCVDEQSNASRVMAASGRANAAQKRQRQFRPGTGHSRRAVQWQGQVPVHGDQLKLWSGRQTRLLSHRRVSVYNNRNNNNTQDHIYSAIIYGAEPYARVHFGSSERKLVSARWQTNS